MAIEPSLHYNGPDIYADVKEDHDVETDLGAAALAERFQIEDVAESEAADANRRERLFGAVMMSGLYAGLTCRRKGRPEKRGRGRERRSRFLGRWTSSHYISVNFIVLKAMGESVVLTCKKTTIVPKGQKAQ